MATTNNPAQEGRRIGLALSGGGFRATLFHLGVIRFLRDAELLSSVSHMTAVSGGSILAAHLALNWDRYNGSFDDFDAAAAEIIRFAKMDVRNRIVRRLPFTLPIHAARWLLRMPMARRLTRSGMLEQYYERELYGQRCLYELPKAPELHLLATNLGEGALCSFTRDGVIMQKRLPGKLFHFERIHSGLGTIALAVAASSAFPGFFPPLLVHGEKIGAIESQFHNQLFTDGGIFDNLGVRMFRSIERNWLGSRLLQANDFYDVECIQRTLGNGREDTDLVTKRLRDLYDRTTRTLRNGSNGHDSVDTVVFGLQQLVVKESLYQDDVLGMLKPEDAEAETLLKAVQTTGHELRARDRIWLNRQILEAALRHTTGSRCLRPHSSMFDAVLVSDAGKQFEAAAQARMQGLVTTALRASDILMDRVWQLESEAFTRQPGFTFISTNNIVAHETDPKALHPEIQRQVSGIRTDFDRFTPLEISSLVQHGYCVARSRCTETRLLSNGRVPDAEPWNPIPAIARGREVRWHAPADARKGASATTVTARLLEQSKRRKIWSRLLDWRDWVSYLYLPLVLLLLLAGPALGFKFFELHRSNSQKQALLTLVAGGSEDYREVSRLLEHGASSVSPAKYELVEKLAPVDYEGFQLTSETQVYDLRQDDRRLNESSWWTMYTNRRYRVARSEDKDVLRLQFQTEGADPRVQCRDQALSPKFKRLKGDSKELIEWELSVNLARVPIGQPVDVIVETESYKPAPAEGQQEWTLAMIPRAKFGMISMWVLLPAQSYFAGFDLYERVSQDDQTLHRIQPSIGSTRSSGTIIAWSVINPQPQHVYQCHWMHSYSARLRDALGSFQGK